VKEYGQHRDGGGSRKPKKSPAMPRATNGPYELRSFDVQGGVFLLVVHRFSGQTVASGYYCSYDYFMFEEYYEGEFMAKFLDQVVQAKKASNGQETPHDPDFERSYPALWEFLSTSRMDDGTTRQTATLMAFMEGKVWKLCLHDRETGMSLWAAAEAFWEAMETLEAMLKSPAPQWRQGGARKPKK